MKNPEQSFEAVIQSSEEYPNAAYVNIPFDVEKVYGKKRVKIIATFDDQIKYRGSLVRMKSESHMLLLRKDIRAQLGKNHGDTVKVHLEEDTLPRVVTVPDDFREALQQVPEIAAFFQKMSYTHQKEYVNWIVEAKRAETRQRRIKKAIEMMQAGKKGR